MTYQEMAMISRKRGFRAMCIGLMAAAGLALAPAAFARGHVDIGVSVPGVSVGYYGGHHGRGYVNVGGYYGGYYGPTYYNTGYYYDPYYAPVVYDSYYSYPHRVYYRGGYYPNHHYYRGGYNHGGYNHGGYNHGGDHHHR